MILSRCLRMTHSKSAGCGLSRTYLTLGHDFDRSFQSYISNSHDPYLNLSIEHHLLQKSKQSSKILFLYINRPCVVIGRNQNPWTEVNLSLLGDSSILGKGLKSIDLVRRRSGGGTVFHDGGNVNWTVISPSESFTRDKHAEMVTRALRRCGVHRSRVNERHDIVLDQGGSSTTKSWGPGDDTHHTPWQVDAERTVKVSGSAYKLTRGRALHHGTALLDSPNLKFIHDILTAPGRKYIDSKGVASVSSPVANIGLDNDEFVERVQQEFWSMYQQEPSPIEVVGESWLEDGELRKGYEELMSLEWTYLQTPRFSIDYKTERLEARLEAKNGRIEEVQINADCNELYKSVMSQSSIQGLKVHEMHDWSEIIRRSAAAPSQREELERLAVWLRKMLPSHQQ
ncbi:hypothetical protein K461DRAFT_244281 [Myriangium duriaei CBS 260.36]|uniref:Putative lipoate-protein ligase A n=1 Tax=Myriangium duriaei CBS 260.36 TaxID=1168546 RepID=A0A9P4IY08_9PEZI|nr:hypothetical protein K461DRAFT_244281 [Myriangium duriaei CBS 260.36]